MKKCNCELSEKIESIITEYLDLIDEVSSSAIDKYHANIMTSKGNKDFLLEIYNMKDKFIGDVCKLVLNRDKKL